MCFCISCVFILLVVLTSIVRFHEKGNSVGSTCYVGKHDNRTSICSKE